MSKVTVTGGIIYPNHIQGRIEKLERESRRLQFEADCLKITLKKIRRMEAGLDPNPPKWWEVWKR
jgi:hypothetical protein